MKTPLNLACNLPVSVRGTLVMVVKKLRLGSA